MQTSATALPKPPSLLCSSIVIIPPVSNADEISKNHKFDGQWTAKLNGCGVTGFGLITYDFQLQVSSDKYRIRATAVVDFESGAGQ